MIYFQATLDVLPHRLGEFSEFVGKELVPCVGQYGMKLVGGWVNTVGKMNEVIDLWCFESLEQFGKGMAEMVRDREWRRLDATLRTMAPVEVTKLLWPLPYSPLR